MNGRTSPPAAVPDRVISVPEYSVLEQEESGGPLTGEADAVGEPATFHEPIGEEAERRVVCETSRPVSES